MMKQKGKARHALMALAVAMAAPLLAYDTNLAWVYDTSSRPVEMVATGTVSNASGVDARVAFSAETATPLAELEARPWFSIGFATWMDLSPFGTMLFVH